MFYTNIKNQSISNHKTLNIKHQIKKQKSKREMIKLDNSNNKNQTNNNIDQTNKKKD